MGNKYHNLYFGMCKSRKTSIRIRRCGKRGIRTPERLLAVTRFPGEPVQPLLHLSNPAKVEYFLV